MAILTLIRHGQSTYNFENRFTGNTDVELTLFGKEEAEKAGVKLKNYKYDIAYTSMLKRAQETLQIILQVIQQTKIPIVADKALNERRYGNLQGQNKDEVTNKYGAQQVEIWRRSYDIRPPDGESLADTYDRVVPYYKKEIEPKLKSGRNVLIVAHGNSLRALVMYLEGIDQKEIVSFEIPTGSPRQYVFEGDLKIKSVNYL
ncbi:2,3-bisphosphoglycerate-dependent phosphoglycerate mutase [Flavobacterium sp. N3904]|uniref:2,3-bisphosphoglycerate-dependent phosphoglycerate mutase n=1 Tax=Flavobacterium sp. N3904 TaxID=2986835 RepID=UPI002224DBC8|nr:2,3-bisphosphoglycerate-dependent phosphoglycerate mutase [Flavobacterium sp. N3904]